MGFAGLLPDRRGTSSTPRRRRASRSGRGAARRPAAWSATRWASPTSTRSRTGCSSSASSTRSASRMPDIDIDFDDERRGEVIDYVTAKYGAGQRLPDHHLRHDEGARRGARRRPRARDPLRRGGPHRQAGARDPGHDARAGARAERRPGRPRPDQRALALRGSDPLRPHARGAHAPRVHARRRRGHHAGPAARPRAALREQQGRSHHAVRHGHVRGHRPAQDGLPRPAHAHRDRGRAALHQ